MFEKRAKKVKNAWFKKFLKNVFKNFKRLGLPVSTTQGAQDTTQVTQDVCKKFKKCLKKEQ